MASEIRVDKINSLSGVGTVTLSPTGVDIAGITTAATLRATTGIVTSLTAGSLTSLGAVSGTTGTFSGAVSGTTGTFSGAVSGTTGTFTSHVSLGDNDQLRLGDATGGDLKIYHNGNNSYVQDVGTGNLHLTSNGTAVSIDKGTSENMAVFNTDGSVDLYYNGSKTFETTSDGSKVTGELDVHKSGTGDVFHVQGNGTGAVVAKVENAYNSDNDRFAILELKSGKGSIRFNSNGDSNEGAITYNMADNTMVFGVNNASEKLRIQSGGGISFNGDTASTNALDDYEEGSWTPDLNGGGSSTWTSKDGKYQKVGNTVTCWMRVDGGNNPRSGSNGHLTIYNIPFALSGDSNQVLGPCGANVDGASGQNFIVATSGSGNPFIRTGGQNTTGITVSFFTAVFTYNTTA